MMMPRYVFEFNGCMMNKVHLIQKNLSINEILGFENSACDITGSIPTPPTR